MAVHPNRPDLSTVGTRNFAKLVVLAARQPGDKSATAAMADAFAAILSEVTPAHREVMSASMTAAAAAPGRHRAWAFPPGMTTVDDHAREKWVSLVLLDCVNAIADQLSRDHPLAERQDWSRRLRVYTKGAEGYPIDL